MSLQAEDVTVALAVEDAVPVLLAGFGLVLLLRDCGDRRLGYPGAALVVAGGTCKVLWKLIAATTGRDVGGLDALLFPLLGTGFALVIGALLHRRALVVAVPVVAVTAVAVQGLWPFLVLTVAGSTATLVVAVSRAVRRRDPVAAALFGVTLAAAYGLVPLAARDPQTVPLQWIEQSVNTVAQAAFAYATWRLARTRRPSAPRPQEVAA